MSLDSAVQHLLKANRIIAPSQSYKKDNPAEATKVLAYLNGGARPTGVTTEMGLGLMEVEDERRNVTPPPPTNKLTWAPPALTNPVTIDLPPVGGGELSGLDTARDYIINIGDHQGSVELSGGRNIRIIGGKITIPPGQPDSPWQLRRGMKLSNSPGITHVEGVHFTGDLVEGFSLISKDTSIRIQNCRVDYIHARSDSDEHPDLIQVQAGARNLYVDRFTGASSLQGFTMRDNSYLEPGANMDDVILKNVNLIGRPGHLIFRHDHITIPTVLENVWINMEGGADPYWSVYPNAPCNWIDPSNPDGSNTFCREVKWGDAAHTWLHWPDPRENMTGRINVGTPPGGDMVPASAVGVGYVSPGYL